MSYNLIAIMIFIIILIILYWMIPGDKGDKITNNIVSLGRLLPISKIVDLILEYLKKKK